VVVAHCILSISCKKIDERSNIPFLSLVIAALGVTSDTVRYQVMRHEPGSDSSLPYKLAYKSSVRYKSPLERVICLARATEGGLICQFIRHDFYCSLSLRQDYPPKTLHQLHRRSSWSSIIGSDYDLFE
jgi:hypothetical protein